jgi:formate hydrogenlyase subunit 3/multisubunit Na+/H+ antiporter MnhD subunit
LGALVVLKFFQQLFWGELNDSQAFEVGGAQLVFSKRFIVAALISILLCLVIGLAPSIWFETSEANLIAIANKVKFFTGKSL